MSSRPLARTLGVPALTFYGLGLIIGAGIYSIIGAAAGVAGEAVWQSFLLGAVAAALTGLSYAELSTMFPKAGAEYVYLRHAFERARWISPVVGTVLALATATTAATVALAFAGYVAVLVPAPPVPAALALLAAATALNVAGVRVAAVANAVLTVAAIAGLLGFIGVGVVHPDFGRALSATPTAAVLPAAGLVFFAYLGFEDMANLAEEVKEPSRTLPRAILLAVVVSSALYLLVALAALALLKPAELAATASPLAAALGGAGPGWASALAVVALGATGGTTLSALVAGSRLLYGMAEGGDLPGRLSSVLPLRRTPWVAALLIFLAASVLVPFGDIALVGAVSSFGALLGFAAVHLAVLRLRRVDPGRPRPFRLRLSVAGFPVAALAGLAAVVLLGSFFEPRVYLAGAGAVLIALLLRLAARPKVRAPSSLPRGRRPSG